MFSLSRKRALVRLSVIGIFVTAALSLLGFFVIEKIHHNVEATGDGETVYISNAGQVSYDNWSTNYFQVSTSSGTIQGYCAQPRLGTPSGSYTADLINSDSNTYKLLKLMIYIKENDNAITDAARAEMFDYWTTSESERYAWSHAIIGAIYDGDYTGISEGNINYINRMIGLLQGYIDREDTVWLVAKTYKIYRTLGGDLQDIIWIEGPNFIHGNINVQKCDAETGACTSQSERSLAGVTFGIYNNSGGRIYNDRTGRAYNNGELITTATTGADGKVSFTGLVGGSYLIKETGTNNVYALNPNSQTAAINNDGETKSLTFNNRPKRGDVTFVKTDGNGNPMPNALFSITALDKNNDDIETHIVVSNDEGVVNTASSFNLHSNHTNGYDAPYDLDKPITFLGYGSWFGLDGNGQQVAVNDNVGALPYGKYLIQELRCSANIFCYDIKDEKTPIVITEDQQLINLGDWDNHCAEISLHTTATDGADGDHFIESSTKATIKDHVNYCVREDLEYTIRGILIDKETGEPLEIDGKTFEQTAKIEPTEPCGEIDMNFTIDASKLGGKDVVVYEYLYYKEGIVESHEDLEDEDQTVSIVELYTFATNSATGKKVLPLNQDVEIKDVVNYCLKPGQEYTVKGVLMNKNTQEAVLYNDEPVTSELTFTPEEACGQVEMYYTMNTTDLAGAELVIFESLYINYEREGEEGEEEKEQVLILSHEDYNNDGETVVVEFPAPETGIATAPSNNDTGPSDNIKIILGTTAIFVGGYIIMRVIIRRRYLVK